MKTPTGFFHFLTRLITNVARDNTMGMAAQTTFYLTLTLCPLLLFLTSALRQMQLSLDEKTLSTLFPVSVRTLLTDILSGTPAKPEGSLWGALVAIWSGSAALWALMRGIFYAMESDRSKQPTLAVRLVSIIFLLGFTLAGGLSLLLIVFSQNLLLPLLTHSGIVVSWIMALLSRLGAAGGLYLFVWLLYRFTPGVRKKTRRLWPGALLAAIGWTLASLLFEIYITQFSGFGALYGGLGAFLGLIMWLYVVSIVVLAGAELNALLAATPATQK